jgi:UDPglucose--hexose-1-phosphate uridylyltransferase
MEKQPSASNPSAEGSPGIKDDCPFCVTHEDRTPPETWAMRPGGGPPNSDGWLVRTVPNLYPVLAPNGDGKVPDDDDPLAAGRGEPELLVTLPATGEHEVIVHAPEHYTKLGSLPEPQFLHAMEGWQARLAAHPDASWVHLMVNEGTIAGASLEHSHSQLYALRFVPVLAARERERFKAHHTRTMGGCLLCDLLQEEVRRRERVIAVDEHAVLLAPHASRSPYELMLVPRVHAPSFLDSDPSTALLLREGLRRLERLLGASPPLNLWLRTPPQGADHYHWRIEVVPRLTQLAGLELGAGISVNVLAPEDSAAQLRDAD